MKYQAGMLIDVKNPKTKKVQSAFVLKVAGSAVQAKWVKLSYFVEGVEYALWVKASFLDKNGTITSH